MTDGLTPKQKISPYRQDWRGMLALGLAVGLCLVFRETVFSTLGFPMPCQDAVFYPLLLLTLYPPLQIALWISVLALVVGLLALARSRRMPMIFVLLACLVGSGVLVNTWQALGPPRNLMPIDTYAEGDSLYQLVYVSGEGVGIEEPRYPIRTFVLLQCEGLGWGSCETIGAADMTVGGVESPTKAEIASAHLEGDMTHFMVILHRADGWEETRSFIGCMLF